MKTTTWLSPREAQAEQRQAKRAASRASSRSAMLTVDDLVDLRGTGAWSFTAWKSTPVRATLLSWSPKCVQLRFRREDTGAEFVARMSPRYGRNVRASCANDPTTLGIGTPPAPDYGVDNGKQRALL